MHLEPSSGTPRDVGRAIVDLMFIDGRTGRIPIVGVTGVNWNVKLMALKFLDASGFGTDSGAIAGTAFDPVGDVIPGVTVRIVNTGTNQTTTMKTNLDIVKQGYADFMQGNIPA